MRKRTPAEMERHKVTKAARSLIRLKHSLAADEEINAVLPDTLEEFDDALARGDFALTARVWNDPVIDDARLKALFAGYKRPAIAISGIGQEGAAGSLYCTVSGTLTDAGDPSKRPQKGEIVLKRVNDVPGATAQQLRWTIRSSSFVENMQRTS